jgi:RNA polymerase sigma factor (sigma-70 family)
MHDHSRTPRTRQSLLGRLKDRDDHASWSLFFETYRKVVYAAAVRAGLGDAEAKDVVQETFVAVSRHMPGFVYDPEKGSFRGWLMRQTNWRIVQQLRLRMPRSTQPARARTDARTATIDRVPDDSYGGLETLWAEEWQQNLMRLALDRVKTVVDPKHYQIFDLSVNKRWPMAKIAKDLAIGRASIYVVRHRVGNLVKAEVKRLRQQSA